MARQARGSQWRDAARHQVSRAHVLHVRRGWHVSILRSLTAAQRSLISRDCFSEMLLRSQAALEGDRAAELEHDDDDAGEFCM